MWTGNNQLASKVQLQMEEENEECGNQHDEAARIELPSSLTGNVLHTNNKLDRNLLRSKARKKVTTQYRSCGSWDCDLPLQPLVALLANHTP